MKNHLLYYMALCVTFVAALNAQVANVQITPTNDDTNKVSFDVMLTPGNYWYQDSIKITIDHPNLEIIQWHIAQTPLEHYDPFYKETKKVYEKKVSFDVDIKQTDTTPTNHASLHLLYHTNSAQRQVNTIIIPLDSTTIESKQHYELSEKSAQKLTNIPPATINKFCQLLETTPDVEPKNDVLDAHKSPQSYDIAQKSSSWSSAIGNLISTEQSLLIRLLLIFILGLLLSFTPCIYPMIPVTIGVLQTHIKSGHSLWRNFLLALMYTVGLSTTFALFGLLASCVGPLCGQLLSNKIFVLALVLILFYFALSMLGLYEIRLPRVFTFDLGARGSFLAVFLFGAASGTFASPCVSPGLALLLTIVATLGSKILGFLFLFTFGIGLSAPLLVVGTLSNSISFLPRAGTWMIEVKRFFGILMMGAAFFYLSFIVAPLTLQLMIAAALFLLGLFYAYNGAQPKPRVWKFIENSIAIILVAGACIMSFYAVKTSYMSESTPEASLNWTYDYQTAQQQALAQGKLLFVDVWAPYCSVCVAINRKVLVDERVVHALNKTIPIKIDISKKDEPQGAMIQKEFAIVGVPVFMLIDPKDSRVIKRWGGEIYTMPIAEFVNEINKAYEQ